MMSLQSKLPWAKTPIVINAPLGGFAGPELAIAVAKAAGMGFIGLGFNVQELEPHLAKVEASLTRHNGLLPIGVGLLQFGSNLDDALPILEKYRLAAVWLFAAKHLDDYGPWSRSIRQVSPDTQVWVQVGSVAAAVTVAEQCQPDVICVQGSDAGGHGLEKGAGIISLLPEVSDALAEKGHGGISLVAAGGISDGRGAAAALALGAQGVVMGTRFLAASEVNIHPSYRAAVLAARDGGQSTTRAKLFDNLRGPNIWPVEYDGRSVIMESFEDHAKGVGIEEIRAQHAKAITAADGGFGQDGKGRAAMWAGTGVGLVNQEQPAAEIVQEVRHDVVEILERTRARM